MKGATVIDTRVVITPYFETNAIGAPSLLTDFLSQNQSGGNQ
jgi:hypothetical protein